MGTDVQDDRLAISWNVASENKAGERLIAVSDKNEGVYRKGDWNGGTHQMNYTGCVDTGVPVGKCCELFGYGDAAQEQKSRWKLILQNLRETNNTRGLSKQLLKNTKFLDYFFEDL
jgi:hypothetical protein